MPWEPPDRNYDGIQHEVIRKVIDPDFCVEHDKLSAAYYDGGVYTAPDSSVYDLTGPDKVANKVLFDKLHALVMTHEYNVSFADYNSKLPIEEQVKETTEKELAALKSAVAIAAMAAEGISVGVPTKEP